MILGDLLDSRVLDPDGKRLGYIIDVRFLLEGGDSGSAGTAHLDALIVSPHSRTSFLGYERSDVTAPLLIARFLRWRHRGSCLIQFKDVAWFDSHSVRLRSGYRVEPLVGPGAG